ncbi:uncharacterized protein LAESUDRAFT_816434 [Laetiporus sulphureus 93-53]|uniref:F-box domain-containing protein n=1 Tax=Laetiporus sulphureus 93-53 TaxID=1314785 RepID=A0A165BAJ2_9APHY|nr:uncharacterized protein LAESUDRAFT_816434 [Laetiporus sulphureus 93-53]KZT00621.1 hypothetical protein LAESUDRAFT_816434 [Laetiporus sulphureus 93-53]
MMEPGPRTRVLSGHTGVPYKSASKRAPFSSAIWSSPLWLLSHVIMPLHSKTIPIAPAERVPIELWEHIIDHLWKDKTSLQSCSLTCRVWLPATRVHLFDSIIIKSRENCLEFQDLIEQHATSLTHRTNLLDCIHSLTFQEYPFEDVDWKKVETAFQKLQNVWSIVLDDWTNMSIPGSFREAMRNAFPYLESLTIKNTSNLYMESILFLMTAFPSITSIDFVHEDTSGRAFEITDVHQRSLTEASQRCLQADLLTLGHRQLIIVEDFCCTAWSFSGMIATAMLLQYPFLLRLSELRLMWNGGATELAILRRLFEATHSSLESLVLGFFKLRNADIEPLMECLDALRVPLLYFLGFSGIVLQATMGNSDCVSQWILFLLSRALADAQHLRELAFDIILPERFEDIDLLDWEYIDSVLLELVQRSPSFIFHVGVLHLEDLQLDLKTFDRTLENAIVDRLPRSIAVRCSVWTEMDVNAKRVEVYLQF